MSQRVSGQDWFYHAPGAKENAVKFTHVQPASQIPGIGNRDESPLDLSEDITLRRKWIRETDSKYVRLAKAGGRKDLFIYREHKSSKDGEVGYPRVDWFDHAAPQADFDEAKNSTHKSSFPEWYVHEEYKYNKEDLASKQNRSILGFDDMSIWKREAADQNERRTKSSPVKLPSLIKNKYSKTSMNPHLKRENEKNSKKVSYELKLPEIKTIEEIKSKQGSDIGQLMSMKYQHDWLDEQTERKITSDEKKIKEMRKDKAKHENELTPRTRGITAKGREEKPMFKLSRFANVAPKTDSHRR